MKTSYKFLLAFLLPAFLYGVIVLFFVSYFGGPFNLNFSGADATANGILILWAYLSFLFFILLPISIIIFSTIQWLRIAFGVLLVFVILVVIFNMFSYLNRPDYFVNKEMSEYFYPTEEAYLNKCDNRVMVSSNTFEFKEQTGRCQCSEYYGLPPFGGKPFFENPDIINYCKNLFINEQGPSRYKGIGLKYSLFDILVLSLIPPIFFGHP